MIENVDEQLRRSLGRREVLLGRLTAEDTNCYRLLHGVAEGRPGLTLDRYGPILLAQTWRDPITVSELENLHRVSEAVLGEPLLPVWNHRNKSRQDPFSKFHPFQLGDQPPVGREMGLKCDVTPRHRGLDPLLFLDFRAGRRRIRERACGKSVLNLFAYTCFAGIAALAGGASRVWNVDFSATALGFGARNAELNGFGDRSMVMVEQDVIPALRQLAGLPVKGRGARRSYQRLAPETFDLVVLDPPRWAKSAFGAVDIVRDYPSLLKPALLATSPGGWLMITNNAPEVSASDWLSVVRRTGEKCGRPVRDVERLPPEEDFPTLDAEPPLKMAWLQVD